MRIQISDELKKLHPGTALGILHYKVKVKKSNEQLLSTFDKKVEELAAQYKMEDIAKLPHIATTRTAYKAFGKKPSEYRNAAEAMLRRVVKGQGLYHINNVVEVNNLISISSSYSIGSYDVGELRGDITLQRADDDAHYGGIGKGSVNISHLPVLYDEEGAFGNPTSDSKRAMIQEGEREVISVIYSFDGISDLDEWMKRYADCLEKYCGVRGIEIWTV